MYGQEVWLRRRQRMETFYFRYAPPIFEADGEDLSADVTVNPPYPGAPTWQCSVYYLWWEFLRLSREYMERSKANTPDYPTQVMRDFGDLDAYGGFEGWWRNVGRKLFCEPREHGIRWGSHPSELPVSTGCIYISVPFRCDVDQALTELRDILKPEMDAIKAEKGASSALYPVFTKPVLTSLYKRLQVLRCREEMGLKLSEIGRCLNIGPQDSTDAAKILREISVSRYMREAKSIRDHVRDGYFPILDGKAFEALKSQGLLRKPGTRINDDE